MAKRKKSNLGIEFLIIALIAIVFGLVLIQNPQPTVCTMDAKLCPDGSYVGRVPPDCRFAPCPSCTCPEGYVQDGDVCNPRCYYSTPKCLMPSLMCTPK